MDRRSIGEGSIVQRKDGRWQASLQVDGQRRTAYGRTRTEAAGKLADLRRQANSAGALPTQGKRTLNDLLDVWLEIRDPHIKPKTSHDYRQTLDCYIRPALGKTLLSRLESARIERLLVRYYDRPRTAQKVHLRLSQALALGVRWGWLANNPCDRVERPRYQAHRKELWTREQLRRFLQGTREHWLGPLCTLLAYSGMRLGESLALTWNDVNLASERVMVSKTLQRLDGQWIVSEPKTRAGVRTITLPPVAIEALQHQAQYCLTHCAGRNSDEQEPNGGIRMVFVGERDGAILSHSTVSHSMRRECGRLDLAPMTPHGLRHMHASLLLAEGLAIPAVSQRLGHANAAITMSTYAHFLGRDDAQATEAIGRALGQRG